MNKKLFVLLVMLIMFSFITGCKANEKLILKIEEEYSQQNIKQAVDVIEQRLINYGFKNVSFLRQDDDRVIFEISKPTDMDYFDYKINYLVSSPGNFIIKDSDGKTLIKNSDLERAEADKDQYGRDVVNFSLNKKGTKKFEKITSEYIGKRLEIHLDNVLLTNPIVNQTIPGGKAMITGYLSMEKAKLDAALMHAGPLTILMEYETIQK